MDREKVIKAFDEAKELVWRDDDEYTVGYNNGLEVGKDIAIAMLNEQETEIRQLRLALDIAKGTCKGIKVEGR